MSKNVAIAEARRRSRSPVPTSAPGFCKREVRECYRIPVSRSDDAASAWRNAKHKHFETDPGSIPRGVPVFWLGGSDGHGHVSIATGAGGHWTTDLVRPGFFDRTGIARVSRTWSSLRLVGWTEDFDGVTVWRDGKATAPHAFALGPFELDAAMEPIHEVDDREEAFAMRDLAVNLGDDALDDAMAIAARRWTGARA